MISIVAVLPQQPQQQEVLKTVLACFDDAQVLLVEDARTENVNAALADTTSDRILIIDPYSLPLGEWQRVSFPQRFGILGGICKTYAGTRAGYHLNRSMHCLSGLRRQAIPITHHAGRPAFIDLPNEGCLFIRRSVIEKIGLLDPLLDLSVALNEFTLRALEHGIESGFDGSLGVERIAGKIEPLLHDEAAFAQLRSDAQWKALLTGPARRAELRTVHVIAHGARDERRLQQWLRLAGYPVAHSLVALDADPGVIIVDALLRRERNLAFIDLRVEPAQDWLLMLVEATYGEARIGFATCDADAQSHRLVACDATATLVVTERVPAQITLDAHASTFDEALIELSTKAAALGVVTHSVPLVLDYPSSRRARHLDVHTLQSMLQGARRKLKVSMVLLAGSNASVHRFTTDALRSYSDELAELFVVVRSDAPKITARLRNHPNVELFVDAEHELAGNALSRALAAVTGDIIVIIRDDYLVSEEWLATLMAHLDRLPHAGAVVPRLSAVPGIQNCESEAFADSMEFRKAAQRRRRTRAREAQLVDFVHMPSLVMRRAVLEKVGCFDEDLATSNYGVIDYCLRMRTAGFTIALAEDVFVHHIPFEHTNLPFDELMNHEEYAAKFAQKWSLEPQTLATQPLEALIATPLAYRRRFILPTSERMSTGGVALRSDEERVVFLLPVAEPAAWEIAGNIVRKYITTFTSADLVTLAIGRKDQVGTQVVAQRIRKIIAEAGLDETAVPDIVIADAESTEKWLETLPNGPQYLLAADAEFPSMTVLEDLSPSGLRRSVTNARGILL